MKINDFNIRTARLNDLINMQTLFVDSIKSICKKDYNPEQINAWISGVENSEKWIDIIQRQYTIVAETNDILLGFATLANHNYFDLLYVNSEFQNLGIAKALFADILQKALKEKQKVLDSDVSITALPFFQKFGFKIISEQRNYRKGIVLINYKMQKNLYNLD